MRATKSMSRSLSVAWSYSQTSAASQPFRSARSAVFVSHRFCTARKLQLRTADQSGNPVVDHVAADIGQPEITTLEAMSRTQMVQAEAVQHRGM